MCVCALAASHFIHFIRAEGGHGEHLLKPPRGPPEGDGKGSPPGAASGVQKPGSHRALGVEARISGALLCNLITGFVTNA